MRMKEEANVCVGTHSASAGSALASGYPYGEFFSHAYARLQALPLR